MRRGSIYRRCTSCGRRLPDRRCENCGSDRFRWAYTIDTSLPGAPRRQETKSGFPTKAEAINALSDVQVRLARNTYVEPSRQTVASFLKEWLGAIEKTVRPTTLTSYRLHVDRYIAPHVGDIRLQHVTGANINELYAKLLTEGRIRRDGGLSPTTVRRVHATLHRALRDAVRWDKLVRNPCDQADPPRVRASRPKELATWTPERLRDFLNGVSNDPLQVGYLLAATTGMRRGEVAGLRWEDVDLGAATISVRRSRVVVGYQAVEEHEPKTARGRRQIALDVTTVSALREHRKGQVEDRMRLGPDWHNNGLVLTHPDGSPIHPEELSRGFDRQVKELGLPKIRFHDLRHTHATLALQAGVHPKVVSERLGHANIGITMDTYSHAIPAMQKEAADRVAELVFGPASGNP